MGYIMSNMNAIVVTLDGDAPAVRPFTLMRDRILSALATRRAGLGAMYSPLMGRPEVDPVRLTATACNLRRWARRLCWEERKEA